MKDEALAERCRALKLVLSDVGGVLTERAASAMGVSLPAGP